MIASLFTVSWFTAQLAVACPEIRDADRRAYSDVSPIMVQLDSNGKADRVTPHVYSVKVNNRQGSKSNTGPLEAHWIAFDLERTSGRVQPSFFQYQYGTSQADY